ncbi:M28 family metallopeptidase [Candidatus Eisenbacteria bacterium]|uniref:M28 family metallopeptidase n=1 Tax=Eiseniibacteriota bacterium TaxID=2212470 RepID=A0ABV6YKM4_UNCEI
MLCTCVRYPLSLRASRASSSCLPFSGLITGLLILFCSLNPVPVMAEPSSLDSSNCTGQTYVVTSPEPPLDAGIEILDRRGDRYLISANEEQIARLAEKGCRIAPFTRVGSPPADANRQWSWRDLPDPAIEALVAEVTWDGSEGLAQKIAWLESYGTRYSFAPQCEEAADSIAATLAQTGLPTLKQGYLSDGDSLWNVEATQIGRTYPDSIFIICAHYDSYSNDPWNRAPGADDNASGTAAVITAAEILSHLSFEYTIKYVLFSGEEQYFLGSVYYVQQALAEGWAILGALNADMIGWWEEGVDFDLEIETNNASLWMATAITNAADLYTSMPYELHIDDTAWWGDFYAFWYYGFNAVNHEESWDWGDPDFNPYYHSPEDLLQHLDPGFTVGNAQILVAALATLARPYDPGAVDLPVFGSRFSLAASPNPFREQIRFVLTAPSNLTQTTLRIYDLGGRRVAALPVTLEAGRGVAQWRADDAFGGQLRAGQYFCRPGWADNMPPVEILYVR